MVDRPGPADLTLVHRYGEPFAAPDGIAYGRSGRLYVALAGSNQISILDSGGTEVSRFPTPVENARQDVPFDTPASLAFDGRGSLLVTNQSYINAVPAHWAVLDSWVDDDADASHSPGIGHHGVDDHRPRTLRKVVAHAGDEEKLGAGNGGRRLLPPGGADERIGVTVDDDRRDLEGR